MVDFSKRIFFGVTGMNAGQLISKLNEIKKYNIKDFTLFLEILNKKEREKVYEKLKEMNIKKIPLIHIRHDMEKKELEFLLNNFKSKYLTIHEEEFNILKKWKGDYKRLFLELNYDNFVPKTVDVSEIGGFCIDLSHFKASMKKHSRDFEYVVKRRKIKHYFKCNHLNGYSVKENRDLHTLTSLKQFDYLKTLPKFVFGNVIAIETFNSIKEQLKFKKHLIKLLNKKFN